LPVILPELAAGAEITSYKTSQDLAIAVLELFVESPGSQESAKPLVHVRTVGPPTTESNHTNGYRDFDDEDFKIIQSQKPSLVI